MVRAVTKASSEALWEFCTVRPPKDRLTATADGEAVDTPQDCCELGSNALKRTVVITNPHGLHMRPATAFAKTAMQYQSVIQVHLGDRCVNGKSVIELVLLAAEMGAELILEVNGPDASAAAQALIEILTSPDAEEAA